jgi:hypothetical protein
MKLVSVACGCYGLLFISAGEQIHFFHLVEIYQRFLSHFSMVRLGILCSEDFEKLMDALISSDYTPTSFERRLLRSRMNKSIRHYLGSKLHIRPVISSERVHDKLTLSEKTLPRFAYRKVQGPQHPAVENVILERGKKMKPIMAISIASPTSLMRSHNEAPLHFLHTSSSGKHAAGNGT